MKRGKLSMLGAGFAMAVAGLMGTAQASAPVTQPTTQNEIKATAAKPVSKARVVRETIGGLDLDTYMPDYGMSPKEYGIRYGHGNRSGKFNRLRLGHNAKLKRRVA